MPVQEHLGAVLLHPLCALQGEAMRVLRAVGKDQAGASGAATACAARDARHVKPLANAGIKFSNAGGV